MTEEFITKKEESENVQNIPIQDKRLYNAYIKLQEESKKIKKWGFAKAERRMVIDKLEWFMRDKALRDAFFEAEKLLKNVNSREKLETLLKEKARELDEQFDKEYDNLKKLTVEIFEYCNLTENDKRDALTIAYYDYYIKSYLYSIVKAYIKLHHLPYYFIDKIDFNELSNTISHKPNLSLLKFLNPSV